MKKLCLLLLTLSIASGLCSCGGSEEKKVENTGGSGSGNVAVETTASTDNSQDTFNDEEILKNLTTTSYTWADGSFNYVALVVKNNSNHNCELTANIVFKNAEGQTIGADESSVYMFEKNTETCIVAYNEDAFATFDYTYDVSKADLYKPGYEFLSLETSHTDKKAILTFKNNATEEINARYDILFMQGDTVVDYDLGSVYDLKPGATEVEEANFYNSKKGFDNIKIYYNAYISEN